MTFNLQQLRNSSCILVGKSIEEKHMQGMRNLQQDNKREELKCVKGPGSRQSIYQKQCVQNNQIYITHIITIKEGLQKQMVVEGKNTSDELKICDVNFVEDHCHYVQSGCIYICMFRNCTVVSFVY